MRPSGPYPQHPIVFSTDIYVRWNNIVGPMKNVNDIDCWYVFITRLKANHTQVTPSATLDNPPPPSPKFFAKYSLPLCENLYTPLPASCLAAQCQGGFTAGYFRQWTYLPSHHVMCCEHKINHFEGDSVSTVFFVSLSQEQGSWVQRKKNTKKKSFGLASVARCYVVTLPIGKW